MSVSPRTRRSESELRPSARLLGALVSAWTVGSFAAPAEAQQLSEQFNITPSYVMGLTAPTDIAFTPDGRAIITLKGGQVRVRQTDGTLTTINGMFPGISTTSEQGLLGVVVDPGFTTNQRLYFYVSDGPDNTDRHRVRRATLSATNTLTVEATPLVSGGLRSSNGVAGGNHDGGGLVIHNGHLYIGVGDTGFNASPPNNKYSSCLNVANGKILRVQLSDGQPVPDNPLSSLTAVTGCSDVTNPRNGTFVENATPDKRIYAWGLRNPWRLWVDPMTNLLWVGDVGEQQREEISVGPAGSHFGYPFREGSRDWRSQQAYDDRDCMDMTPAKACVPPAVDYAHDGDDENCVIGGLIPSGCGWSQATGGKTLYFFGDHGAAGRIWTVEVNPARNGVVGERQLFAEVNDGGPVSFRQGPDDALYVVLEARGAVMRIAPKACTTPTGAGGAAGGGGAGGAGGGGGISGSGGQGAGGGTGGNGGAPVAGTGGRGGSGGGPAGTGGNGGTPATGTGGAGGTGGMTASGSGGQTGSGGTGGGMAGAGSGGQPPSSTGGGCGCSAVGPDRAASLSALALLLAVAASSRRRSKREG